MSLKNLEKKWNPALASILAELTKDQFKKVLFHLDKIPQGKKEDKAREDIPYLIIQYYGPEGSIIEINKIMKQIPRMDAAVQEHLRPFVKKLKKIMKKDKETTSKPATGRRSGAKKPKRAAAKTIKSVTASGLVVKEPKPAAGLEFDTGCSYMFNSPSLVYRAPAEWEEEEEGEEEEKEEDEEEEEEDEDEEEEEDEDEDEDEDEEDEDEEDKEEEVLRLNVLHMNMW